MITRNRFVDIIISISSYISIFFTVSSLVLGIMDIVMIHFFSIMNPSNESDKIFVTFMMMIIMCLPMIYNLFLMFFLPSISEEEKKMLTKKELKKKHDNIKLFGKNYFLVIYFIIHLVSYIFHVIFFSVFVYFLIDSPGLISNVSSSEERIKYEDKNKCCVRYGEITSTIIFSDCPFVSLNQSQLKNNQMCWNETGFTICDSSKLGISHNVLCRECFVEDFVYSIFMGVLGLLSHIHYVFVLISICIAWNLKPMGNENEFLNQKSIDMNESTQNLS